MVYLQQSDYTDYGLDATTSPTWIAAASALMDAHCRRATLGVAQYAERLRLAPGRNSGHVTFLPLAALAPATSPIVSARARYGLPRRGEGVVAGEIAADFAQAFALPGTWTSLDPSGIEFVPDTGELTFPRHPLGIAFNEVEVTYTAGLDPLPDAVKLACAQIVRNAQSTPALNVRAGTLDRMRLEYFADSLLDGDVRRLLAPFVAQKAG